MSEQPTAAIVVHEGAVSRLWGAVGRALGLSSPAPPSDKKPDDAAFAGVPYASHSYSPLHAMSAMAVNPWILACVRVITSDLTRCPVLAYPSRTNGTAKPSPTIVRVTEGRDWMLNRRQLIADRVLTGRAAALILRSQVDRTIVGLARLHPENITPIPAPNGDIEAWDYKTGGASVRYERNDVLIVEDISWEANANGLNPLSIISTLEADIKSDLALANHTRISAEKGRPDAIVSPRTPDKTWGDAQIKRMKVAINELFSSTRNGGAAIFGEDAKMEILGWSPKEMEGEKQRIWTRQTIMAVFQVPPARLSLDTLNRATQDEQMTTYWVGNIQGLAAEFDAAMNAALGTELGVRFETDFSDIPHIQAAKKSQLERVEKHIKNGMPPAQAYQYEGLTDVDASWFSEAASATTATDSAGETQDSGDPTTAEDLAGVLAEMRDRLEADDSAGALSLLEDAETIVGGMNGD